MHFGIDYGGQLNGTTAVCLDTADGLVFRQSAKKASADDFLLALCLDHPTEAIYIDAPLSLPPAFTDDNADNFFYRTADTELQAMSPMFLGGLTARAMRLRRLLEAKGLPCFETYPKALMRLLFDDLSHYKREAVYLSPWTDAMAGHFPVRFHKAPVNWHQFDAALCWLSGYRHRLGIHETAGDPGEGQIIY